MAHANPTGALCILEDLPGKRLALGWEGPAPYGREPRIHALSISGSALSLTLVSGLWKQPQHNTFSVDAITALHLDLPPAPRAGLLQARLTLVHQNGTELSARLWVRDLDLLTEAKDLLVRMGAATRPEGEGAFRSNAAPRLGFLSQTKAPAPYAHRLSLWPTPREGAEKLPERSQPANYEEAAPPPAPQASRWHAWLDAHFPTDKPPPGWPIFVALGLAITGCAGWSMAPWTWGTGDSGPMLLWQGVPFFLIFLAFESGEREGTRREDYQEARGFIGLCLLVLGVLAFWSGYPWVPWGIGMFALGLPLWLLERRYPPNAKPRGWKAFQLTLGANAFWLGGAWLIVGGGMGWLL